MARPLIGMNMDVSSGAGLRTKYALNAGYADSIWDAGGMPVPIPCVAACACPDEFWERLDGFLFIGGTDYPPETYGESPHPELDPLHEARVAADLALAQRVLSDSMPLLGICGGQQLLSIVRGGKLVQHVDAPEIHAEHPDTGLDRYHEIRIEEGRILVSLFGTGTIRTNSAHHQAVRRDCPGQGLKVVAYSADGVVEAIESADERFVLGVQWHPE